MKNKILLLIFGFLFINASVISQTYKGHRLIFAGETISAAQSYCNQEPPGRKHKVNLKISQKLKVGKIYGIRFDADEGFNYYFVSFAKDTPFSDEDYSVVVSSPKIPITCDADGDGIDDSEDDCPNEYGPSSNNGCPAFPDLTVDLDDSYVRSACFSCKPVLDLYLQENKRYLIQNGTGQIHFDNLEIRNVGTATSSSAVVRIYFSINSTIGSGDKLLKQVTIPSRGINNSYGIDTKINGWDFNNNLATGDFYLIVQIDATNTNNEGNSGENNNTLAIPFRYEKTKGPIFLFENTVKSGSEIFEVGIYDISGNQIQSKKVDSVGEKELINNLPKGFYIIRKGDETYKIVK